MRFVPLSFLTLLLVALSWLAPAEAEARLKVVATLPDLAAVAREVGGPDAEVTALSLPSQDPHFVDARPHLVLALNRADLLLLTGLELETGWLPTLITGARNARIQPGAVGYLDASTVVPLKQVPAGRIDRSMGDIHPGGNPHYMSDPRNGARVAKAVADRLAALDPAHRAGYQARAKKLAAEALAVAKAQEARFKALPASKRRVVTYHQSLVYLLEWLQLEQVATLEPKPGIPPSPGHIASVLGTMRQRAVGAVLQEEYFPTTAAKLLAQKTQATLVVLPGGPDFEKGQGYVAHVQALSDKIFEALK